MTHKIRVLILPILFLVALGVGSATAAAAPPSDAELRGLKGGRIQVGVRYSSAVTGLFVYYDAEFLELEVRGGRTVRIRRSQVTYIRWGSPTRKARAIEVPRAVPPDLPPPSLTSDRKKRSPPSRKTWFWGMGLTSAGVGLGLIGGLVGLIGQSNGNWNMTVNTHLKSSHNLDEPSSLNGAEKWAIGMGATGGALLLIGTPIWVAASVQRSLARAGSNFAVTRKKWITAGFSVFISGLLLSVGGAGMAIGVKGGVQSTAGGFGVALVSLGTYTMLCVGLPMWIQALKTSSDNRPKRNATRPVQLEPHHDHQLTDPNHEQAQHARLMRSLPRATVFSSQFRF